MTEEQQKWHLGQTSTGFETNGRGVETISSGHHDKGGVSYGAFQLASKSGTVKEYLDQSAYKKDFEGLTPGSKEFSTEWSKLASGKDTREAFADDQYNFIKKSHYEEQVGRLKHDGLDLTGRGSAVQDALWSTSVQYRNLTKPIFEKGLEEKFGDHYELAKLTDKDIIEAVQDYKVAHVEKLFSDFPDQWDSLNKRAKQEKADLLQFNDTGIPVDTVARAKAESKAHTTHHHGASLELGAHGDAVGALQKKMNQLGYTDAHGHALAEDKHFGPGTKATVEAFQKDHGLAVDGKAGAHTLAAIERQYAGHTAVTCGLDDPGHPDALLFQQSRSAVHRMDAEQGRTSDHRSDNLAAALAVAARRDGLTCINQAALSDDADKVFVMQGSQGNPFNRFASVSTMEGLNTPIEQSSAQWLQVSLHNQQQPQQTLQQNSPQQATSIQQQVASPVMQH